MTEATTFDSWAVVELFGHQQIAGRVTEATIGGCAFLRVDVPEQPPRAKVHQWDADQPSIPAYTRYFGNGAIYALNPCSEDVAKRTAQNIRVRPPLAYTLDKPALTGPRFENDDQDPDA